MVGGQGIHDLVPHASPAPANEAIVAGGVRAKVLRQITPRRTRTQNPKDAVEHAPVIYTGHAARFARQERLDGGPFIIGEFVAHDSRAPVWELESRAGPHHQPARVRHDRCQYPDFTSAFGGTADMVGLAADLVPVENDPTETSASISCCSSEAGFNPYKSAHLSR